MKNIFIDLGTHMGGGLLHFIKSYKMTPETWEIHTFEPQPKTFELAKKNNKEKYIGYPYNYSAMNEVYSIFPNINRYNVAASDYNGTAKFFIDKGIDELHMGCTMVEDLTKNEPMDKVNNAHYTGYYVIVPTVDIYEFIEKIEKKNIFDKLVIKIDTEGAEFAILDKFLSEYNLNKKLKVKNIDIFCEFHHRLLPTDLQKYKPVSYYIDEFKKYDITLSEWH